MSTTMALNRILALLVRDKQLGSKVVPIIPDEARTFGMEGLFRSVGIYNPEGQNYTPEDADQMMYYKETTNGQVLQEGINEAGAMADWIAAATAYSNHGVPMIPFYTFYSMFGFQRTGDLIWQAADIRARGFLMGATAGRTTLLGEGLQHQDGHSLVLASTVPAVQAFDPAFAYEVGAIVRAGIDQMYGPDTPDAERDVIYYLTLYNENYPMPALPEDPALAEEFKALGGTFRQAEVKDFVMTEGKVSAVQTQEGEIPCDQVVLTTGVWSKPLMKKLGITVPLETERGYHIVFEGATGGPTVPVMVASGKFVATPMAQGVRCAGVVEFGGLEAGPSRAPFELLRRQVAQTFPGLEASNEIEWQGHRPAPTDSLPLIGEVRSSGVFAGFGHHHIGLTGGPKTGRWLAQMITGQRPNTDMTPYDPQRFAG